MKTVLASQEQTFGQKERTVRLKSQHNDLAIQLDQLTSTAAHQRAEINTLIEQSREMQSRLDACGVLIAQKEVEVAKLSQERERISENVAELYRIN